MLRCARFLAAGCFPVLMGLVLLAPFVLSGAAFADDAPKLLGKFDDWAAYSHGNGADRICYILAAPKTMEPKGLQRGDVYFMVTHRPARNVRNEISMRAGYAYSPASKPFATIGKTKFQMFSGVPEGGEHRFWAWLDNTKDEAKMVKAIRSGSSMVIKGKSSTDKLTTDTYSLKGSGAAMDKINAACP